MVLSGVGYAFDGAFGDLLLELEDLVAVDVGVLSLVVVCCHAQHGEQGKSEKPCCFHDELGRVAKSMLQVWPVGNEKPPGLVILELAVDWTFNGCDPAA